MRKAGKVCATLNVFLTLLLQEPNTGYCLVEDTRTTDYWTEIFWQFICSYKSTESGLPAQRHWPLKAVPCSNVAKACKNQSLITFSVESYHPLVKESLHV